jgi:dGTPase
VNHDIIDAIRAGLITEENLPHSSKHDLGRSHSERLNTMICDIVEASWAATGAGENPVIQFSPKVHAAANELREFMFKRVYLYDETLAEAERGKRIVTFLFQYFVRYPEGVSADYSLPDDPVERRAADYVSGMTDRYALRLASELGCEDARGWKA